MASHLRDFVHEARKAGRVQVVLTGANMTPLGKREPAPAIVFDDRDMKHGVHGRDEPMVISVVAVEYKIEHILIDQGSSANILYWSTVQKMQLPRGWLHECSRNLYGFAGECIPIRGTVELETCFGEQSGVRIIPVLYTVVDALASYNIIIGRPTLNSLKVRARLPVISINALELDLDPRCQHEHEGAHPAEELKEVQLGPQPGHVTKVGSTLGPEDENLLVSFLRENHDVFAWSADDMSGINLDYMCHRLSVESGPKPVTQKKRKQGEEKRKAAKEETRKLISARFVRQVQYPT
ncbi:hypothetical protein CR513_36707, partial [Mucuna pruriens]